MHHQESTQTVHLKCANCDREIINGVTVFDDEYFCGATCQREFSQTQFTFVGSDLSADAKKAFRRMNSRIL